MVRLNLGCGDMLRAGWINVDLYNPNAEVRCDVKKLPYEDNTVDEIYSSHVIEHFHYFECFDVLREWCRVLKPGGRIMIETPDMLESCRAFVTASESDRINMYSHFFAKPWASDGEIHKFLFTETQLAWTLDQCGYSNIQKVPAPRYIGREHICLGMTARKASIPLAVTQLLCFEIGSDCNMASVHTNCPNNCIKRTSTTVPDDVIVSAAIEAYSLGFKGLIGWSFYNEPMIHEKRMFILMEMIRASVPSARFILWTNGTILSDDPRMSMFELVNVTNYTDKPMDVLRHSFGNKVVSIASMRDNDGKPLLDNRIDHYTETNFKSCTLPFDSLVISNTGEAYVCCIDWENKIDIGNIFTNSLIEIDSKRAAHIEKIAGVTMNVDAPEHCLKCAFKWDTCTFDKSIQDKALEEIRRIRSNG